MWKTDFALFDVICYDVRYDIMFRIIWHLTRSQYGCYRLKHAILQVKNVRKTLFITNSWILMTRTEVSMYFPHIYEPFYRPLGFYLIVIVLGCQFWLDSLRQADTCDRGIVNQLFWPFKMVQSSWHFVYSFLRVSISKLYRWFGCKSPPPPVLSEIVQSWWVIIGEFDIFWPSEVIFEVIWAYCDVNCWIKCSPNLSKVSNRGGIQFISVYSEIIVM